jgi:hypothetical protein
VSEGCVPLCGWVIMLHGSMHAVCRWSVTCANGPGSCQAPGGVEHVHKRGRPLHVRVPELYGTDANVPMAAAHLSEAELHKHRSSRPCTRCMCPCVDVDSYQDAGMQL